MVGKLMKVVRRFSYVHRMSLGRTTVWITKILVATSNCKEIKRFGDEKYSHLPSILSTNKVNCEERLKD
jgi:hypothetical protein